MAVQNDKLAELRASNELNKTNLVVLESQGFKRKRSQTRFLTQQTEIERESSNYAIVGT